MSEPTILTSSVDGVVTLTLNRPARKNGLNRALVDASVEALIRIGADPDARVLVLTGAGDSFCSGMDLGEPIVPDDLSFMRATAHLCNLIHGLPIPVIAKVRGAAYGFGANLGLCADLVVAGESAVFGEIFTERGLSVDGGGSWVLPRLVGLGRAKELLFFAVRVSGVEAAEMGLVNRCVPDAELDKHVDDWATRLADGPQRALSLIKDQLNRSLQSTFAEAVEAEAMAQALAFRSPEVREGMQAFFEKRDPDFRSVRIG